MTAQSLIVARKEIVDHVRDWRSLASGMLYTLMGPFVVAVVSFSGAGGGRPAFLLSMMSVFALVSAFTGGMAIAIDITAGERERRSLVPLFLTPIAGRDLAIGKWLAVCAFALGALMVNIAGVAVVTGPAGFGAAGDECRPARLVGAPRAGAARVLRGGPGTAGVGRDVAPRKKPTPG